MIYIWKLIARLWHASKSVQGFNYDAASKQKLGTTSSLLINGQSFLSPDFHDSQTITFYQVMNKNISLTQNITQREQHWLHNLKKRWFNEKMFRTHMLIMISNFGDMIILLSKRNIRFFQLSDLIMRFPSTALTHANLARLLWQCNHNTFWISWKLLITMTNIFSITLK